MQVLLFVVAVYPPAHTVAAAVDDSKLAPLFLRDVPGVDLALQRKAKRLRCHADSELLVYQIQGHYRIKNLELKALAEKVKSSVARFESVIFKQIPREHPMIARADKLLNQTLNKAKAKAPPKPIHTGYAPEELF